METEFDDGLFERVSMEADIYAAAMTARYHLPNDADAAIFASGILFNRGIVCEPIAIFNSMQLWYGPLREEPCL